MNRLCELNFHQEITDIINQNLESNPNLAAIASLKLTIKDQTLVNHYGQINATIDIVHESKPYSGDSGGVIGRWNRNWVRYDYHIKIEVNGEFKSYSFKGQSGGYSEAKEDIEKDHVGQIEINKIYEDLLQPLSREEILKISTESNNYYLQEAAKNRLLEKRFHTSF